jgi:N-acetylmuramoyl-L-alanine amidase
MNSLKTNILISVLILLSFVVQPFSAGSIGQGHLGEGKASHYSFLISSAQKPDQNLPVTKIQDEEYISLSDVAETYGGSISWNHLEKKAIWEVGGKDVIFTLFSPYVLVDSDVYNLISEVKFIDGTLYLPKKTFPLLWQVIKGENSLETESSPQVNSKRERYDIQDITASQKLNGILIEIQSSRPLKYDIFLSENNWLNLTFFEATLNPKDFLDKKIPGIIDEIKAYQFENSAQLSMKVVPPFQIINSELKSDPQRIQISLEDTTKKSIYSQDSFPKENKIDVIVIDPGHGGQNLGAVGPKGLKEKDITLDIAKRLEKLLKKEKDLKVVLTRTEDVFVPLEQRGRIANQAGGDLFLSIHCNSAKRKNASGSEVYFLAEAKTDEARAVASIENSAIKFEHPENYDETTSDLDFILLDLLQTEFLKESNDLALIVNGNLASSLKIANRGVDQAGFVVLNKAYMPTVLVETAFISNKQEEKLLSQSSFRDKIALALYQSILDFKKKYEVKK